jgi:SAM-dependent methyltransferase
MEILDQMKFVRNAFRPLRQIASDAIGHYDFWRARRVLCNSGDLLDAEKRLVRRISLKVNSSDSMYRSGWALSYLTAGLSASRCIQASLDSAGKRISAEGAVLDFPCGYGRVLRFLRAMFPDSEITAAELETAPLDFCERVFSVRRVLSQRDLRSLSLPRRFDLIWCGSLITHLDERAAVDLLDLFCRHLSDGGICIFTSHGQHVAEMMERKELTFGLTEERREQILRDYQQKGYGYADYPWLAREGRSGYGISVTSQSRMVELAQGVGPWEQAHYLEKGWHGLQDVHAFALRLPARSATAIFDDSDEQEYKYDGSRRGL